MTVSPDTHAAGIIDATPEALRYDRWSDDPAEVGGILRGFMPPRSRVLDIGCGTGALTIAVNHDKGNDLWGIEPDLTRAAMARPRGINVACGGLDVLSVRHSAGNELAGYRTTLPWRILPGGQRRPIVRNLTRAIPGRFACQYVRYARLPAK